MILCHFLLNQIVVPICLIGKWDGRKKALSSLWITFLMMMHIYKVEAQFQGLAERETFYLAILFVLNSTLLSSPTRMLLSLPSLQTLPLFKHFSHLLLAVKLFSVLACYFDVVI